MIKIKIADNIENIREVIEKAAIKSGRNPEDITLIGVTKTVNEELMKEAIETGIIDLGENKVQEITRKFEKLSDFDIKWHMIGHLQSNKVKYIIDKIHLIHSLDRLSLAKEIHKRAEEKDINVNVLLQINISEEITKYGLKSSEVFSFIEKLSDFNRIKIKGLMTMAPYTDNPEKVRYVFRGLKKLSEEIGSKKYKNVEMEILSMGMTNDYDIAIEEGATMVRIGTGIFNERKY